MENQDLQPVSNQTVVPSQPQSSGPSKTFLILIVVVLLAAMGVGGYVLGTQKVQQAVQSQVQQAISPSPVVSTVSPTAVLSPTIDVTVSPSSKSNASAVTSNPTYLVVTTNCVGSDTKNNQPHLDMTIGLKTFNQAWYSAWTTIADETAGKTVYGTSVGGGQGKVAIGGSAGYTFHGKASGFLNNTSDLVFVPDGRAYTIALYKNSSGDTYVNGELVEQVKVDPKCNF